MRRALALVLLPLIGCAATAKPLRPMPVADGWSTLADGELERAQKLFAARYEAGDADGLGGLIRTATIRGEDEELRRLLAQVDGAKASARTLLAAGLAVMEMRSPTPAQRALAQRACALRKQARHEVRAGVICSRLALYAASAAQRRCVSGCSAPTVVPMSLVGPSPVVMASINGKAPAPFLVDSGASTCVLTKRYAASIGVLPTKGASYRVNSPGGLIDAKRTLASLRVGATELADVPFALIDLPFGSIAGLISPHDAYRAFRTRFDFRAFSFTIAPSKKSAPSLASLPLRIAEGNPHIWVAFGKRPPRPLTLDTGAVNTTLSLALEKLGKKLARRGKSNVAGAGGKSAKSWATTESLTARAGSLSWKSVHPTVFAPVDAGSYDAFRKYGLLGMDFLMGRVLEIDVPARVLRISPHNELRPWKVGHRVVLEILGEAAAKRPSKVHEQLVARQGEQVTLEVQLSGVVKPSTFRIQLRDSWNTRGTWLIARPAQRFMRRAKDGTWKEAPRKELIAEWMKVFVPFKTSGKNVKVKTATMRQGGAPLACTMMSMDAQAKAGPARLRMWQCPSLPVRVAKLELVKKSDGATIWGFRQLGVQ